MKKFGVYYKTNVESFMIAEFDTLAEAKEYCTNETKGCIPVSEDDTRVDNHNISFYYEVYDGNPLVVDEDGDVTGLKDPVYETDTFYSED